MHLTVDLLRTPDGRLEGTVITETGREQAFSGTLDLLRVLEDLQAEPVQDERVKPATPRLAAVMGLVFSGLFIAALVVVNGVPHLGAPDAAYGTFYDGAGNTVVTAVALYLVPLAGIAFLWFVVALRSVLDTLAPAPSAMANGLNLLSGVLFVALLFAGTAALATPVFVTTHRRRPAAGPGGRARPVRARLRPGLRVLRARCRHVRADHDDAAAQRGRHAPRRGDRRLRARDLAADHRDRPPREPARPPGLGAARRGRAPAPRPRGPGATPHPPPLPPPPRPDPRSEP